jgi:hypothetical protein
MMVQAAGAPQSVSGKVTAQHCDRLAVVYVRQSTLRQVTQHSESTKLQYALVERANALGWAPSQVLVIDEDIGFSAGGGQDRPGFTRLVSEVSLGHVGVGAGHRDVAAGSLWPGLAPVAGAVRAVANVAG